MDSQTNTSQETTPDHRDCVVQSTIETFRATCGIELKSIGDEEFLNKDGVILAVISIVGDVDWSIFLGFPQDTAVACAAKFAGFDLPFESDDMGDAIGELTNILAGQVKTNLDARGIQANISLPSVMRAESMKVLIQRDGSTTKTCFESEVGKLWTGVVAGNSPGFI